MNLTHLECFLAVADELHFGRAAQRLHRSPATVSEAIAALERTVGGPLFARTSRTVRLTENGLAFLNEVKEPYGQLLRAHENALARAADHRRIRLAHTPELGSLLLPGLHAVAPRHGGQGRGGWRSTMMHTQEQLRAVQAGTVDIGLCWSVKAAPPLRRVILREVPVAVVLCADDPLAEQPVVHLNQLRLRELVTTSRTDNSFVAGRLQDAFTEAGVSAANVHEVDRYEDLVLHVAAGRFVGVHAATIAGANRVPDMAFRPVEPALAVSICALSRSDHTEPRFDALLEKLLEVAAGIDLG